MSSAQSRALANVAKRGFYTTSTESSSGVITGDYPGPITPISVPVLLQHRPVSGLFGHMMIELSTSDGKREILEARSRLNVSSIGRQTIWDFQFTELGTHQGRDSSENPPLVQVRMLFSDQGIGTDVDIDFPYYRQIGAKDIPAKGSKEHKEIEKLVRNLSPALPQSAIRTGDLLFTPKQWSELIHLQFDALPNELTSDRLSVRVNTLRTEVMGTAWERGRQKVVGSHLGALEMGSSDLVITVTQTGFVLIDLLTAQRTREVGQIHYAIRKGDKRVSMTFTMRSTQSF